MCLAFSSLVLNMLATAIEAVHHTDDDIGLVEFSFVPRTFMMLVSLFILLQVSLVLGTSFALPNPMSPRRKESAAHSGLFNSHEGGNHVHDNAGSHSHSPAIIDDFLRRVANGDDILMDHVPLDYSNLPSTTPSHNSGINYDSSSFFPAREGRQGDINALFNSPYDVTQGDTFLPEGRLASFPSQDSSFPQVAAHVHGLAIPISCNGYDYLPEDVHLRSQQNFMLSHGDIYPHPPVYSPEWKYSKPLSQSRDRYMFQQSKTFDSVNLPLQKSEGLQMLARSKQHQVADVSGVSNFQSHEGTDIHQEADVPSQRQHNDKLKGIQHRLPFALSSKDHVMVEETPYSRAVSPNVLCSVSSQNQGKEKGPRMAPSALPSATFRPYLGFIRGEDTEKCGAKLRGTYMKDIVLAVQDRTGLLSDDIDFLLKRHITTYFAEELASSDEQRINRVVQGWFIPLMQPQHYNWAQYFNHEDILKIVNKIACLLKKSRRLTFDRFYRLKFNRDMATFVLNAHPDECKKIANIFRY
jgi:hypothetical protein